MDQQHRETRTPSRNSTISTVPAADSKGGTAGAGNASYVVAIAALAALSFAIEAFAPGYSIIFVLTLATAAGLACYLGGRILGATITGIFLRSFASQGIFALVFVFGVSTLSYVPQMYSDVVALPLTVFIAGLLLWRFGGILTRSGLSLATGMLSVRLGGALMLFLGFLLLSFITIYAGYPFLYASVAYGALSISPVIAFSDKFKGFRAAGEYLLQTTGRWTVIAFFIGCAAAVLSLPGASIYTYVVVLILTAMVLGYVAIRVYSLGSSRLQHIQEKIYQKHVHEVDLVSDESFDFLRTAISVFVKTGSKGDLLIALANLLTNAGVEYPDIRVQLHLLVNYELPGYFRFSYSSMTKQLELEIQRRIGVVQVLMNNISAEATARSRM